MVGGQVSLKASPVFPDGLTPSEHARQNKSPADDEDKAGDQLVSLLMWEELVLLIFFMQEIWARSLSGKAEALFNRNHLEKETLPTLTYI